MTRSIIIGTFGPSARQIGDTARELTASPKAKVVVNNRPQPGNLIFGDRPFVGAREKDYNRGLSYLHDLADRRQLVNQVFLGGACNPTTWRADEAIPMLEDQGVAYYDPQIDDWSEQDAHYKAQGIKGGIMEVEAEAKTSSHVLLFVFSSMTRGIASLNEAYEFIGNGQQRVVLVMEYVSHDLKIGGQELNVQEAMDINVARAELLGFAVAKGVPVYKTVSEATQACAKICLDATKDIQIRDVG